MRAACFVICCIACGDDAASTTVDAARDFLDQVSNRRLEKPFDLKELRRLVNELIR